MFPQRNFIKYIIILKRSDRELSPEPHYMATVLLLVSQVEAHFSSD